MFKVICEEKKSFLMILLKHEKELWKNFKNECPNYIFFSNRNHKILLLQIFTLFNGSVFLVVSTLSSAPIVVSFENTFELCLEIS